MESGVEVASLVDLLNALFDTLNFGDLLYTASDANLYDVIKYINENLAGDMSNEKLSEIACFNPRYFIKVFKKQFGTTPHRYIQNIRLKYAVNMLQNGDKLSVVAKKLGFEEVKSFLRFFKQYKEMSPSTFLKK
jgi:two-component system response regulator YesN